MRSFARAAALGAVAAFFALLNGCTTMKEIAGYSDAAIAADYLDEVEQRLDRWGSVTAGELALGANGESFRITIKKTAEEFIADARNDISGAATVAIERILENQTRLAAQPLGPNGELTTGTLTKEDFDLLENARKTLSSPAFAALCSLATGPDKLPNRASIMQGSNDFVTAKLMEAVTYPTVDPNKRVIFGIVQVTCLPGYRTRKGYSAQINFTLEYAGVPRTPLKREETMQFPGLDRIPQRSATGTSDGLFLTPKSVIDRGTSGGPMGFRPTVLARGRTVPSVHSVLPLLDAQTFDLQRSDRAQLALAALIQAVAPVQGMQVDLDNLTNYIRREQRDLETRNAIPLVTSYTDGNIFGFQIEPQIQALGNPTERRAKPASVLHPVTFPALVTVIVDDSVLAALTASYPNVDWYNLSVQVDSRWIDMDPFWRASPSTLFIDERFEVTERAKLARLIDRAAERLSRDTSDRREQNAREQNAMVARLEQLESQVLAERRITRLPKKQTESSEPRIASVYPSIARLEGTTTFVLELENLWESTSVTAAYIEGAQAVPVDTTNLAEGYVTLEYDPSRFGDGREAFSSPIVLATNHGLLASAPVSFTYKGPAAAPPSDPTFELSRDAEGRITAIRFKREGGAITPEQILQALAIVTAKDSYDPNLKITFDGAWNK
jgi:hypothetical protein